MKTTSYVIVLSLTVLIIVLISRAMMVEPDLHSTRYKPMSFQPQKSIAISRLANALQFQTISYDHASPEQQSDQQPSPVSSTDRPGYQWLKETIGQLDANTLVAPRMVVGATDARHYEQLSDQVFRFLYLPVTPETINSIHGVNERVATDDFINSIRFYYQLIRNVDAH